MTTSRKVYSFYGTVIAVCILLMLLFHFNIYAKLVLCTMIFLCLLVMRGLKNVMTLPPEINPDTMQIEESAVSEKEEMLQEVPDEPLEDAEETSTIEDGDSVDTYLRLHAMADEELRSEPGVDQNSPSYNNHVNELISMMLHNRNKSISSKTKFSDIDKL